MFAEFTSVVPRWVLWGIALGCVATALVALTFYLGDRFVPARVAEAGRRGAAGDERRRREIRTYLTAADERFAEDHAFDGVSVPFYLPERGVAITFDAHDYFRLEGEGVYTVLCEHEMPGRGLGRRLPFDVDEPDWATDESTNSRAGHSGGFAGAGRAGRFGGDRFRTGRSAAGRSAGPSRPRAYAGRADPVGDAFDELGVSRDADLDEVKGAYRERVKETHPDQGGDEESFRRVREAYATARNHVDGGPADRDADRRRERSTGYGR